ncbi:TPA: hypothetical protein EYP38_01935 [Candidatus Micrarchaeota archaeon]|nr:hypothetical protein [Candidatus Micrarchaeota archaeon]
MVKLQRRSVKSKADKGKANPVRNAFKALTVLCTLSIPAGCKNSDEGPAVRDSPPVIIAEHVEVDERRLQKLEDVMYAIGYPEEDMRTLIENSRVKTNEQLDFMIEFADAAGALGMDGEGIGNAFIAFEDPPNGVTYRFSLERGPNQQEASELSSLGEAAAGVWRDDPDSAYVLTIESGDGAMLGIMSA